MGTDDLKESLDKSLFSQIAADRMVHYLEYLDHHKSTSELKRFSTDLYQLDSLLDGFHAGEMIVITGPTGSGKTLLADSIGQRFMRIEKIKIAWLSFEVPVKQMVKKYQDSEDGSELGLYIPMELISGNFEWLKTKCLEAIVRHGCKAIFIDHLHFLVDMDTKLNMSLNIGAVMRRIKQEICIAMNLVVFVIAHQGQKKEGEPSIDNIRDSSFIAQEADIVLVVYRTADPVPRELEMNAKIKGYPQTFDQGYCAVKIEKARRTGVYKKRLKYQKKDFFLEEVL